MNRLTVITPTTLPLDEYSTVAEHLIKLPSFTSLQELNSQKIKALSLVETEFCAIVNEGDSLPYEIVSIVGKCLEFITKERTNICYTDVVKSYTDSEGEGHVEYLPLARHGIKHVVNQFAVLRTSEVKSVLSKLPVGLYWTEGILFKMLEGKVFSYVPKAGCLFDADSVVSKHENRLSCGTNSFIYYVDKMLRG